jgi:hypothetical protein
MVLMGGRVSGYAIAGMWRPEGYNSDVAHLQSEASETKPYGVCGLLVSDGAWPFSIWWSVAFWGNCRMVTVNCQPMMLVLVRGLYMVKNPGILNAKNLVCKTSTRASRMCIPIPLPLPIPVLCTMFYVTLYYIKFRFNSRSKYTSICTCCYTYTRRFDRYNLSRQKMRENGPIILKLLKFQYFWQNTGISLLFRYNALIPDPLYVFCYTIHYYTTSLPLPPYTIP